jgi:transposase
MREWTPRKAEEIAKHCGVSKATVHQVISIYNRFGVAAVETAGKGGRHREYLTLEQEREFLAPFFSRAQTGELTTAAQIKQAFETQVGHAGDKSTPACSNGLAGATSCRVPDTGK